MRKESWGGLGGRGGQREPTHFVYVSLGVVGSCSPLPTFSTKKSKTFFLWNLPVEKFGWAVVGQLQISEWAAKRAQ